LQQEIGGIMEHIEHAGIHSGDSPPRPGCIHKNSRVRDAVNGSGSETPADPYVNRE